MTPFLLIAGGLCVLAAVCVIFLLLRLRAVQPKPNFEVGNEVNEWLRLLIAEPDHLSNMIQFAQSARSDPSQLAKGPETIKLFVTRLEEVDLHLIGPNGVIESYDPSRHRSISQISMGTDVRVVRAGWRHGAKVLRPSLVEPVSPRRP